MGMSTAQQDAFDAFCNGKRVALLGSAGSGKSFLIKEMLAWAKKNFPEDSVVSCAFTNSAAEAIGGLTIHTTFNTLPLGSLQMRACWKGFSRIK